MTPLTALWLPILLAAALVFVVSSLIHMFTPWHKDDFARVPDEDRVADALRPFAIPPGEYQLPRPTSMADLRSEAFQEKVRKGPHFMLSVLPNRMIPMGGPLVLWFLYSVVIGVFAGYVAGRALPPGSPYLQVFRFAGVAAFLGYAGALWQATIWFRKSWKTTLRATLDGLLYGLLTAGAFGWLWPR
jgi:hypothetical protein